MIFERKAPEVILADGEEAAGFAVMLADLFRQNLEKPEKRRAFRILDLLRVRVTIEAPDAEVTISLLFGGGRLTVRNGESPGRGLKITANSDVILEFSEIKAIAGVPVLWDEAGKAMLKRTFNGEILVQGAASHPVSVFCLLHLMAAE